MSKCPKCGWTLTWLDDEWWCGDCDWTGSEAVRAASQTSTNVDDLPDASLVESSAPLRVNDTVSEGDWCECPGTTRRHFRTPACPVTADRQSDDPAHSLPDDGGRP